MKKLSSLILLAVFLVSFRLYKHIEAANESVDRLNQNVEMERKALDDLENQVKKLNSENIDRTFRLLKKEVRPSIFLVSTASGFGTGFQIEAKGKKYVLTNQHVCQNHKEVTLVDQDNDESYLRKVLKTDPYRDICLVEGIQQRKALKVGKSISVDEDIAIIGHPSGYKLTLTKGEVFDLDFYVEFEDDFTKPCEGKGLRIVETKNPKKPKICLRNHDQVIQTTAEMMPGSSGSPVFNIRGEVVGIAFMYDQRNQWSDFINVKFVHEFLKDVK